MAQVHESKQPERTIDGRNGPVTLVRKVWREILTSYDRARGYPTVYPIFLSGMGERTSALKDADAPRTLEDAKRIAYNLVNDNTSEWTHALVYEMKAVYRVGQNYNRVKAPRKVQRQDNNPS